ncbi:chromate transporter [Planococcus faecalis]|uniref:chromate transporter n=1 Tax=Planococcus faecalis TaxID=1598147 RepID=UPI000B0CEADB
MIYWSIFLAFFIPGILGYGGAGLNSACGKRSSRPLRLDDHPRVWRSSRFGKCFARSIATKMAGYIGYMEGGILGSIVALVASVAPSLILMVLLMVTLLKYKDSPKVQNITKLVRPVIAVLLGAMTLQFFMTSIDTSGTVQTVILVVVSYWLLEMRKVHPAFVIIMALGYGAVSGIL